MSRSSSAWPVMLVPARQSPGTASDAAIAVSDDFVEMPSLKFGRLSFPAATELSWAARFLDSELGTTKGVEAGATGAPADNVV